VFRKHHASEDVLTMLTRVNKQLTTLSPSVACVVSQLTKEFFLNPCDVGSPPPVTDSQPPVQTVVSVNLTGV
jgi:hypothetical protein